ncbi:hypothetical protein SAMN05421819_1691 [Bryocella elongata]|uniref:Outer membrane protein beta-barrel domain-containing protein n=1 Tax=Bryocella elongata TaxID=863522 RepID=A0A1H5WQM9_9BACT|nr:outer membrane beta-barrel protein [Bryocella elongata]SEG01516.1 hypothetical protein SAMN05421819_1691 [Bryocella elongata]
MIFGKRFGGWRSGLGLALVSCGLTALPVAKAQTQAGVYVGYAATRMSDISCLSTSVACSNGTAAVNGTTVSTGHLNPSGVFVGGYYDWRKFGPMTLGFDVRYMDARSNKSAVTSGGGENMVTSNTVLGGVRGSFPTPIHWIRPYIQASVGHTSSNVTEPTCITGGGGTLLCSSTTVTSPVPRQYDSFFTVEGFGGVDIRISSFLSLRAIELGYGNMNRLGNGTSGTTSSVGLSSVGAAVILHLPQR